VKAKLEIIIVINLLYFGASRVYLGYKGVAKRILQEHHAFDDLLESKKNVAIAR